MEESWRKGVGNTKKERGIQSTEQEAEKVRAILTQQNCLTCTKNGKGFCSGVHKRLDPKDIAVGKMECIGEKYEPILTRAQVEDIVNIWTYSVAPRTNEGEDHEHPTRMLTDQSHLDL
jgi:hypothetical protein